MEPTPRIPSLAPSEWSDDAREVLAYFKGDGLHHEGARSPSCFMLTLANHPALAKSYLGYGRQLLRHSDLPDRPRELATLRVAWLHKAEYEWIHHVRYARALGISDEELEAIKTGPDAPVWSGVDRAVLEAVDSLAGRHEIDDSTWQALAAAFDKRQLMEMVFVVGHYISLAMVFSALHIPLEPGLGPRDYAIR